MQEPAQFRQGSTIKACYLLALRSPQEQVSPDGLAFSSEARSQVHSPAGLARHEHRGPAILFSVSAFSQLQSRAERLPHEQVDFAAHAQPSEERPQHVAGLVTGKP